VLPHPGENGSPAPLDITRQSDVDRDQPSRSRWRHDGIMEHLRVTGAAPSPLN